MKDCSDLLKLGLLDERVVLFNEISSEGGMVVGTSMVFRHSVLVAESKIALASNSEQVNFLFAAPAARVIILLGFSGFFNGWNNFSNSFFDHFLNDNRLFVGS